MTEEQVHELDTLDKTNRVASHQRGVKSFAVDKQFRLATDEELVPRKLIPIETFQDVEAELLEAELEVWRGEGLLPVGQGGRSRTTRKQHFVGMRHVIADTQAFEEGVKQRALSWHEVPSPTAPPFVEDQKYALVIFSGHRRVGDIASWLSWDGTVQPICIDLAVDAHFGDASSGHWIPLIQSRRVVAAHAAPPCETYTLARWIEDASGAGPRPLRSTTHPWCMPLRKVAEVYQCATGTSLMLVALRLVLLTFLNGGATTLEHPRGPAKGGEQWCIWHSGFLDEILKIPGMQTILFLQGPLGRPFAKPTRMLTGRLPGLAAQFYTAYNPRWRPTVVLGGKEGKTWRTSAAKIYPTEMCRVIAEAFSRFAATVTTHGTEPFPDEAREACEVLSKWDPYQAGSHGMQADYNPKRIVK